MLPIMAKETIFFERDKGTFEFENGAMLLLVNES